MHLLFRERFGVEADGAAAVDLALDPAPVVFGSFSDADLALAQGPGVRTVPLARLGHPMSVDLLAERTLPGSGAVVLRLLGGLDWWRYGADELLAACRAHAVPIALLAGDGADDARLASLSTMPASRRGAIDRALRAGGPGNVRTAMRIAAGDAAAAAAEDGVAAPAAFRVDALCRADARAGTAALVLYRSHALADDLAAHRAVADALAVRGLGVEAFAVDSAKSGDGARFLRAQLAAAAPDVVVSALAFSARDADGMSPLASAGRPVLQLGFGSGGRDGWAASWRGPGPAELAMGTVLPELDGAIATHPVAFKEEDAATGSRRLLPDADGVALAADRAAAWARLGRLGPAERRVAIVASDYPGPRGHRHGRGHAVGLDTWGSLAAMLGWLRDGGYALGADPLPDARTLAATLDGETTLRLGHVLVALQPERTASRNEDERRARFHDTALPPDPEYVRFYERLAREADVLIHLGTHGTLEWLPGKAAGLGAACWPARLARTLPVINPFIVTNPGEAAVARRRVGAVAIGHLAPPLRPVRLDGDALALERLLDEHAAADGLDARRTATLRRLILDRAARCGVLAELDAGGTAADDADRLGRLDAWLCDAKELRIGDGLHVYGVGPVDADGEDDEALRRSPAAERRALLAALDGRFVPAGPGGAPTTARPDVLPTGRNLAGIDPRALPAPSAVAGARAEAAALLDRHLQTEGEPLRTLVLDLWGSAAIRTGGADLALALLLLGVEPTHDTVSGRCDGFVVVPLAELGRPRVDVTIRVSGLFRDGFAAAIALFDAAVRRVAARDGEAAEDNPLRVSPAEPGPGPRVFGPAPGCYGAGVDDWRARSGWSYGGAGDGVAADAALGARLAAADAYLATQDHRGTDLLDGPAPVAHLGGFAQAAAVAGATPSMLHLDRSDPGAPRLRPVVDEVRRIARFRLANAGWLAGMRRHGARGAGEMARGVEALVDYARAWPRGTFDTSLDAVADALLGDATNDAFLRAEAPDARGAIAAALAEARERGDWHPRRNGTFDA